jgi:hypothetical protein
VLVEGDIFRAYFDKLADDVKLEPAGHVRCHWKGSPAWKFFATVDLVSMKYVDEFVSLRAQEIKVLTPIMLKAYDEIKQFAVSGSRDAINVTPGPRGTIGLPRLLYEIHTAHKENRFADP